MRKEKTETIRLPQTVKKQLDKFRIYNRETYSDVLLRLMEQAKISPLTEDLGGEEDGGEDT
jgi:predicted CopG family antitoxin